MILRRLGSVRSEIARLSGEYSFAGFCAFASMLCSALLAQEEPHFLQVVRATYGAGETQMDVTQNVRAAIASGQTNIRVNNSVFGKDPAFGKVKTLSVTFVQGGIQYQTTAREGEQLSFANSNVDQLNVGPQAPPARAPADHPAFAGPTEAQALSPGTTMWLVQRIAVTTTRGITGILPGTKVTLIEDHGEKLLVSDGSKRFEVMRTQITIDATVAQSASASDQAAQNAIVNDIAASISQVRPTEAAAAANEAKAAEEKSMAAKALKVDGIVLGVNAAGIMVQCRDPAGALGVTSLLGRIGAGGGAYAPSPDSFVPRPEAAQGTVLLIRHPKQASKVDGDSIDVNAYEMGIYQDESGARYKKFKFVKDFERGR